MEFKLQKNDNKQQSVRNFLTAKKISGRMQTKIRQGKADLYLGDKKLSLTSKLTKPTTLTLIINEIQENQAIVACNQAITVVYEDENYLVVDKPAGIASVPGPSDSQTTLANRVKGYLLRQGNLDPAVHVLTRLDYNTSGLVLIAKNNFAQGLMTAYNDQIIKRYYAIISGQITPEEGFLTFPLKKDANSFRQIVASDGKKAKTQYWLKASYPEGQLVQVQLHTGRTHQIRAHFAHVKHPLVGDDLYGGPLSTQFKRQLLHAAELHFVEPFSGEKVALTSPLPTCFDEYVEMAKK